MGVPCLILSGTFALVGADLRPALTLRQIQPICPGLNRGRRDGPAHLYGHHD